MTKIFSLLCYVLFFSFAAQAQPRWQQGIAYKMDANLDVSTNRLQGKQTINYTNNSPDTLRKIFIHLFWNAFQPNSMMDASSRNSENLAVRKSKTGMMINDFDRRFRKRISDLTPEEQGYCHVRSLSVNGRSQKTIEHETILEVILDRPILPRSTVVINTIFENQVPKLSRRSGRDNEEGIRYSMGQWYPKVAEYDMEGWHPDDYVRGEFYGVWGDFDVSLTLDKEYKVGATGVLQNASSIGWGYDTEGSALKPIAGKTRTWKFSAKKVHDFVWAADPNYKHITRKAEGGPLMHFIYKDDPSTEAQWQATADTCAMVYPFLKKTFGEYPYPVYSFLQGGGGGTEYSMATLIKNHSFPTALHELCHSWYQMMLGTNENLYSWMDEGFTDYAEAKAFAWLHKKDFFDGATEYDSYFALASSPLDEPMSTPANFYASNYAYNLNAYYKGTVFLRQLGYVVGEPAIERIMLRYYKEWAFRHPNSNDFMRIAEKESGMQLQWYEKFMVNTTKTINYGIDSLWEESGLSKIRLKNLGEMPMPIDLELSFKDNSSESHYIPLSLMYGAKPAEFNKQQIIHPVWKWTHGSYIVEFKRPLSDLKKIEIDPTKRLADIDRKNNLLDLKW